MHREGYLLVPEDTFGPEFRYIKNLLLNISRKVKIILLVCIMLFANVGGYYFTGTGHATGGDMILFWDPAVASTLGLSSIPTGWCLLSTYNNDFPEGSATFGGTTSPSLPITPSGTMAIAGPSTTVGSVLGTTINGADYDHVPNNPSFSYSSDSNGTANPDEPLFRDLELIEYGSPSGGTCTSGNGISPTIPEGGIALFNNGLPASGWTEVTAENNHMIRLGSSDTVSGADTESNNVFIDYIAAGSCATNCSSADAGNLLGGGTIPVANNSHNHPAPTSLSCTSGCSSGSCPLQGTAGGTTGSSEFTCTSSSTDPPYVSPVIAYANTTTPTLTVDITCLFDGAPGSGWTVLSNPGGPYAGEFIRPSATPSLTSLGVATRPVEDTSGIFPATTTPSVGNATNLGTDDAQESHTHSFTLDQNSATNDNLPPSVGLIIAEKVSFTLENYQWYVDNSQVVSPPNKPTDAWPAGSLNVTPNMGIPAIPAPYDPPTNGTVLRLRIQILVSGQPLAAGATAFKLQYANTTAYDCITGSWTDVDAAGGAGVWRYGTSNLADSTTLTGTPSFSVFSPASSVAEVFSKSSTGGIVVNPAATSQTIEYDWIIQDNGANPGSQYAFRPVETDNILLGEYNGENKSTSKCPVLVTAPTTSQELRHGEFFQDGVDEGFEWAT
jgi:hypothetical protein